MREMLICCGRTSTWPLDMMSMLVFPLISTKDLDLGGNIASPTYLSTFNLLYTCVVVVASV